MSAIESDKIFPLLQELCALPGPTGQEEAVREWLRRRWAPRAAEWHEDAVGNLLCRIGGSGPRLLIQAHMDEIGFVVRYITSNGFLLLDTAQGPRRQSPDRRYMVGQVAQVVGRHGVVAEGVFGAATGHVLTPQQIDKAHIDYDDFFVDIGARSRAEAEQRGVHVGAGVIWSWPARRFGTRIAGKAMDDRALLAVMDLLLDELDPQALQYELWFAATIQEENGLHGARALAHQHRFDAMLALDVGLVGDVPTVQEKEYDARLGGGPTLVHKDSGVHYDKRLLWRLADTARAADVPFQHGVYANYGSDAIVFIDHGTPAVLVGVPCRYTHTAFEMIEESDIVATVALLKVFVTTPA
ncbi:MAG: M20/M25/M40 family metallo-hydrolase [Chloroflexota bacterium]|nr:MAG: hypothetical protein DIU80_12330 [Chloroflexota bacterium]